MPRFTPKLISLFISRLTVYARRLSDVSFIGQVVFVGIVLLTSWSGVKTIQTNYGLQKQITALNQQNSLQKLENDNLALQNQYFNSAQYLELSARQNFGLAALGETELIVPKQVALAHTVNLPTPAALVTAQVKQPAYQRNFESWVNFFLDRPN
jgi:cell division protein FtsB